MNVVYGERFIKSAESLPRKVQNKLDVLVEVVSKDPYHPHLHTKERTLYRRFADAFEAERL